VVFHCAVSGFSISIQPVNFFSIMFLLWLMMVTCLVLVVLGGDFVG